MSPAREIATLTVRIAFDLTFWEAIKWRLAGPEFRKVLAERLRSHLDDKWRNDDGEEWKL